MNDLVKYSQDQIDLIKSQIAPKATDNELKFFLYQCQRTGLDPLTRQIYAIHRKDGNTEKMTIQTSIDGFRVVAERSGVYAGQGEPVFIEENGKIISCKISVFKFSPQGLRYEAAVGVAYWDEYVQTKDEYINNQRTGKKLPAAMWAKMPHVMISKCAEAVALRKAFPQDLSGLYTGEEIQQTEDVPAVINDIPTKEERQLLINLLNKSTLEGEEKDKAMGAILVCNNYQTYQKMQHRLEELQKPFDQVSNPSQGDINKKLKSVQS